jgi:septal ring factor EnvC (AmiA/AmiB activator)
LSEAIELMTNNIFKCYDDAYNEFSPNLLERYKFLKKMIKDQKDENSNLMKQIDLINQEISQLFENIIKLGTRLESLEKATGIDRKEDDSDIEENMYDD